MTIPNYTSAQLSPAMYAELVNRIPSRNGLFSPSLFGMQINRSTIFPFEQACSACGGTGSGGDNCTYCARCNGQGRFRYEGTMSGANGSMAVLTSPLPKAFAVAWDGRVRVARKSGPVIRSIAWPT